MVPPRAADAHRQRGTDQRAQAARRTYSIPIPRHAWHPAVGRLGRREQQPLGVDHPTSDLTEAILVRRLRKVAARPPPAGTGLLHRRVASTPPSPAAWTTLWMSRGSPRAAPRSNREPMLLGGGHPGGRSMAVGRVPDGLAASSGERP